MGNYSRSWEGIHGIGKLDSENVNPREFSYQSDNLLWMKIQSHPHSELEVKSSVIDHVFEEG